MNLVHCNSCKERPNELCNINPLQSSYLAAACIAKMIVMVIWRQRTIFSMLPLKDTYLIYIKLIFSYYKHTVHNWLNCYQLEFYVVENEQHSITGALDCHFIERRQSSDKTALLPLEGEIDNCLYLVHSSHESLGLSQNHILCLFKVDIFVENGKAYLSLQLSYTYLSPWRKGKNIKPLSKWLMTHHYNLILWKSRKPGNIFRHHFVDFWRVFNPWSQSLKCLFKAILFPSVLICWKSFP